MKSFQKITIALLAAGTFFLGSCNAEMETPKETPVDPFADLTYIGETEVVGAGANVKLYAEEELFVGYNRLHFALFDSANPTTALTDAEITLNPMMNMGTMQHSCPFESPSNTIESATHTFAGNVVFIMPTNSSGSWTLNMVVTNNTNGQQGIASLPITVVEKAETKLLQMVSMVDSSLLFVALINPMSPEIGLNDFTLGIYTRETMMSFPPVDDIEVDMEPEMPTMNHGSPDNIHPISVGNGRYEGIVNFTMTGYWKVNLNFEDTNGAIIKADQYFDITFQ